MEDESTVVGRILQANTTRFTLGCQPAIASQGEAIPAFGALLKACSNRADGRLVLYGLVQNVAVEDDLFVRQLVAAGMDDEVYIADQRQRRQVPVVVEVLLAGFAIDVRDAGASPELRHYLPPQPPGTLDQVYSCGSAETVRFTARHDWLSVVLSAPDGAADALTAAALRIAAWARPPEMREPYLVAAGRELARLLAQEPIRLDGILRQVRPSLVGAPDHS
jgi:hypothetical protein